ncbi:MAG: D-aminoacyl-tRNA deacylase [Candidatus Woesebacteria bacterium]|nr:D-aminoacyl-tRNA deacylase [Candidatus Woesebacteria bacterium]
MRLVVQRVEKAKVFRQAQDKSWETVGEIGKGFFVLVGFKKGDTEKDAEMLVAKLSKLRVMSDENEKMNLSVGDVNGSMLVVSQFTLHADTSGGNRPSFINAEEPKRAKELYEFFVKKLKENGLTVETGSFGDYMKIETVLDGPVTIIYSE